MNPKISVVVPTLNQGKYIEQTLQSIINQSYNHIEILVIDGGSSDNTVEIIKKYSSAIAYWISEPDKGQSDAISKGLKKATGDVLCWINSDDFYMPDVLKHVGSFFSTHLDSPAVLTGHSRFIHDGGEVVWEPKVLQHPNIDKIDISAEKLLYCWNYSLSQPSTFWNRKTMDLVGLPNEKLRFTMDLEYWIRMNAQKTTFYFIPLALSCFRYHSQSKTMNLKTVQRTELHELGNIYLDKQRAGTYQRALALYFDSKQFFIQADRLSRSDKKESFRLLRIGIKNRPSSFFVYFPLVSKILIKLLFARKKS